MTQGNPQSYSARALSYFKPYWKAVGFVVGLTLISTAISAVEPLVQKYLFDQLALDLTQPIPLHNAYWSIAIMLALMIATEGVAFFANIISGRLRMGLDFRLRDTVITHIYSMPLPFHQRESIESLRTRIDRSTVGICNTLLDVTFSILPAVLYLGCTIFFMLSLSVKLAFISLVFAPLPAVIGILSGRVQADREKVLTQHWSKVFGRFDETLSLIKSVKSFVMEDAERTKFVTHLYDASDVVNKGIKQDAWFNIARNLALALARITVLFYGIVLIGQHQITIGTLVAFLSYSAGLSAPIIGLSGAYGAVEKLKVYFGILFDILDTPNEVPDQQNAEVLTKVRGDIEFRDVTFGYRPDRQVLRNISFTVEAGKTVAIVGPSGSGKTTLVDLLNRFYDPQQGSVLIDGKDLKSVNQKSLRKQIGMVLQDTALFNDTVRNNLMLANPDATPEQLAIATRAANVDSFVARFPEGIDTEVGARGASVSGGERQRLAIARALLKNPAILVFDEASSNLDSDSESLVQEAIAQLRGTKTLLVIAHRLSTIKTADLILVVEHGTLVEQGTHAELIKLGGVYSRLAAWQSLASGNNR